MIVPISTRPSGYRTLPTNLSLTNRQPESLSTAVKNCPLHRTGRSHERILSQCRTSVIPRASGNDVMGLAFENWPSASGSSNSRFAVIASRHTSNHRQQVCQRGAGFSRLIAEYQRLRRVRCVPWMLQQRTETTSSETRGSEKAGY